MALTLPLTVFGAKYADPSVEVYEPGTLSPDSSTVVYRDGSRETFPKGRNVTLLMLNGSFISAEILIENNRSLVPIRVVSEKLNSRVDWNMDERTVTITTPSGRFVKLKIGVLQAETDTGTITLDVEPTIKDSKTYVPLRLVADALNCEVDYRPDLFGRGLSVIVIEERYGYDPIYSREEALNLVRTASEETYAEILQKPDSKVPAYDSGAISPTDELGRYYVFTLAGYEQHPVLFDRYGGDIYSMKSGLPYFFISQGFINIGLMYQ